MSGLWNSIVGYNEKEDNWNDVSVFYFDKKKKYFSVSEIDKEVIPIVFSESHKIGFNKTGLGLSYTPINFLTIYHIDTRQGLLLIENYFDFCSIPNTISHYKLPYCNFF